MIHPLTPLTNRQGRQALVDTMMCYVLRYFGQIKGRLAAPHEKSHSLFFLFSLQPSILNHLLFRSLEEHPDTPKVYR